MNEKKRAIQQGQLINESTGIGFEIGFYFFNISRKKIKPILCENVEEGREGFRALRDTGRDGAGVGEGVYLL